jgi:hypothetical protein
MLVQACLGLDIDGVAKRIQFANPTLPSNVDEIQVRRLRIVDAQIDFAARRTGKRVQIEVFQKSGDLDVTEA